MSDNLRYRLLNPYQNQPAILLSAETKSIFNARIIADYKRLCHHCRHFQGNSAENRPLAALLST